MLLRLHSTPSEWPLNFHSPIFCLQNSDLAGIMRFSISYLWSIFSVGAAARAIAASNGSLHIDSKQPPPAYSIGQIKGQNAKVAGRLFDIDGKVEYFAGS